MDWWVGVGWLGILYVSGVGIDGGSVCARVQELWVDVFDVATWVLGGDVACRCCDVYL